MDLVKFELMILALLPFNAIAPPSTYALDTSNAVLMTMKLSEFTSTYIEPP